MTIVRDVMTSDPFTLPGSSPLQTAGELMRNEDVGDVLVVDQGTLRGLVTDRDIVVRGVADGRDPVTTDIGEICTEPVVTIGPETTLEEAATTMREQAVRRLPVVEGNQPVGVVSLGDLAIELDERSALADISADAPNN